MGAPDSITPPWRRMCLLGLRDEGFESQVLRAARLGATHVDVSGLPAKPRHEKTDPRDPYLEYSLIHGCLFRFVTPEEVRCMTPVEYERRAMETLKARCAELRRHGLRGRMWMLEPHALPPEVFEAHPEWRGPRVEYPPRARRPYYAACIDHPEVLALYRAGVARLLAACPEVELFRFTTNDSASGICWSAGLYSGVNGPSACRERPYAERVAGFLQAWLDGAADAGTRIRVWLSPRGMSADQARSAALAAPDGACVLPSPGGFPKTGVYGSAPPPTVGVCNVIAFLDGLAASLGQEEVLIEVAGEEHWRVLERFVRNPCAATVEQARLLAECAADLAGPAQAEDLIRVWRLLDAALRRIEHLPLRNYIFDHGLLSKRWITRPFAPMHEELTEEEMAFWRPYLFEAGGRREVENLLNVHAIIPIEGVTHAAAVAANCAAARQELVEAADIAQRLPGPHLALLNPRLRVLAGLFRTIGNAAMFQTWLDRAWGEAGPTERRPETPGPAELRTLIAGVMRDEADNAVQLASLIASSPGPVVRTAERLEDEDPYVLPPDLADRLRRKAVIMTRRVADLDRLLPYPNR